MTDPGAIAASGRVVHVLLTSVGGEQYETVLTELSAAAARLAKRIPGLRDVDVYGTDDRSHILCLSEWDDVASWGHAQWDDELQNVMVRSFGAARFVHNKLYRRLAMYQRTAELVEMYGDENLPQHSSARDERA